MTAALKPLRMLCRNPASSAIRALSTVVPTRTSSPRPSPSSLSRGSAPAAYRVSSHPFSSTISPHKGLQPDSADPAPPKTEPHLSSATTDPTPLSEDAYHEKADSYLDRLVLALEEKAETSPDFEVEYDQGTLQLSTPSGTYVINKQRPNKQIWLSSPVSGPKRFDFVTGAGAGQHEKEESEGGVLRGEGDDGEGGRWMYLRDGSSLSDLVWREIGVKAKVVEGAGS